MQNVGFWRNPGGPEDSLPVPVEGTTVRQSPEGLAHYLNVHHLDIVFSASRTRKRLVAGVKCKVQFLEPMQLSIRAALTRLW